jgi:hypothetical protein
MHGDKIQLEGLVILIPGKRFQNAVPVCVLLKKNFRNGIPSQKIPLMIGMLKAH